MIAGAKPRTVVLVGAGHAHLHLAQRAREYAAVGTRLVLVDPAYWWYSGMATGMLAGAYSPQDEQVDPGQLIRAYGGEHRREAVRRLHRESRCVELAGGDVLEYDFVSFNIGSELATEHFGTPEEGVWPVKPIAALWSLRQLLERQMAGQRRCPRLVVVGGGATGCEIAACLCALAERHRLRPDVTLLAAGERLLLQHGPGVAKFLLSRLESRGVRVELHTRINGRQGQWLRAEDGRRFEFNHAVLAVGLRAQRLVGELGLPFERSDGLRVGATLQSPGDPRVFAAGDCASFIPRRLPKLGVFGVRAAPVLHANLLASLKRRRLRAYHPQGRFLSILNLGDGSGLALYGERWWYGRWALRLKDHIDRSFMERYRVAAPAFMGAPRAVLRR